MYIYILYSMYCSLKVSTAVWLCDGALIVVDIVEGVCPQVNSSNSIVKGKYAL